MADRVRYEFSENPYEGMTVYPVKMLAELETVHQGHFDNMKLYSGGFRYWLPRCTGEFGDEWQVHVEKMGARGEWKRVVSYREVRVDEE
jgi:hypothetical protein